MGATNAAGHELDVQHAAVRGASTASLMSFWRMMIQPIRRK